MCRVLSLLLLCLYALSSYALEADSKEKVYITSDSSIYNYKTGVNLYEGHVKVDQGTTHLTGDRVITKNNAQHKMQEAIAYGFQEPAHYWTLQKLGEKEIHATALIIKYNPINSNAILENKVVVTQGDNSFQGELVTYNSKEQTIIVPASVNNHAVLVYNPENMTTP
jgi:lipopolysaccharide export system protein LptA